MSYLVISFILFQNELSHPLQELPLYSGRTLAVKIEGRRRRGRERMRWLDGITDSMDMGLGRLGVGDGQGGLACCGSWGCKKLDTTELN